MLLLFKCFLVNFFLLIVEIPHTVQFWILIILMLNRSFLPSFFDSLIIFISYFSRELVWILLNVALILSVAWLWLIDLKVLLSIAVILGLVWIWRFFWLKNGFTYLVLFNLVVLISILHWFKLIFPIIIQIMIIIPKNFIWAGWVVIIPSFYQLLLIMLFLFLWFY